MTFSPLPDDIAPDPMPAVRAIVVMGVSGSGKTTLGGRIAAALGYVFVEGDDLHPEDNVAKMSAGIPLTDEDRWPWLDRVADTIQALSATGCVVSCSALKRAYRDHIRALAGVAVTFVHPEVDFPTLAHRMENRPGHYMPPSLLDSQWAILERPDADEGAIRLKGILNPDALTDQILDCLSALRKASA
ncbi:gluconokinase [Asticcacaulis solisilvae]|uniref:gluconokinase n=1 Tax=Asticcacaulis solisilvae TaxID=1217274 RepID=UPI003FD83031